MKSILNVIYCVRKNIFFIIWNPYLYLKTLFVPSEYCSPSFSKYIHQFKHITFSIKILKSSIYLSPKCLLSFLVDLISLTLFTAWLIRIWLVISTPLGWLYGHTANYFQAIEMQKQKWNRRRSQSRSRSRNRSRHISRHRGNSRSRSWDRRRSRNRIKSRRRNRSRTKCTLKYLMVICVTCW